MVLPARDTTLMIPLNMDKSVRNLADQTLIIEVEASGTLGSVQVRVLLNVSALDTQVVFMGDATDVVKQFEVPVIKLRQKNQSPFQGKLQASRSSQYLEIETIVSDRYLVCCAAPFPPA